MKFDLVNAETGKQEAIHDPDGLQKAISSGTHTLPKGKWIPAFDNYGEYKELYSDDVFDAIKQGWRVATPTQIAVNDYVKQNSGFSGAAKVALGQFADELFMGIPEMVYNATGDPIEVAKKDALKKEHELWNTIGGVGGGIGSLFVGGPLFKGATAAGAGAVALRKKLVSNMATKLETKGLSRSESLKHAKGVLGYLAPLSTPMDKLLAGAVEGGVVTMPHFLTEAALGDPLVAGEHIAAGIGIGGLFGVGGYAAGTLLKLGGKLTGVSGVLEEIKQKVTTEDGLRILAGSKAFQALKPKKSLINKMKLNQVVPPEGELGQTWTIKNVTMNDEDDFFKIIADTFLEEGADQKKIMEFMSTNSQIEKNIVKQMDDLGPKIGAAIKEIDDIYGKAVMIEPKAIADDLESGFLAELRKDWAVSAADERKVLRVIEKIKRRPVDDVELAKWIADERVLIQGGIEGTERAIQNTLKEAQKDLPKEVGKGLTLERISLKQGLISDAKKRIERYYGPNSKASRIDDELQAYFDGIGYNPKNKTWKDIRSDLDSMERTFLSLDSKVGTLQKELDDWAAELASDDAAMGLVFGARDPSGFSKLISLTEANLAKSRFQKRIKQIGRAADQFMPDAYQEVGKVFNDHIRRKISLIGEVDKLEQIVKMQARYGNLSQLLPAAVDAAEKGISLNDLNPMTYASGGIGAFIGGFFGGGLGSVLGAAGGAGIREISRRYGDQWAAVLLNGQAGKLAAEMILKEGAATEYAKIGQILKDLAKPNAKAVARGGTISAIMRITGEDAKSTAWDRKAKMIEKFNEKHAMLAGSPVKQQTTIQRLVDGLILGGAPKIGEAVSFKMQEMMEYVNQIMPRPPSPNNPFAKNVTWIPSDYEIAAFERKMSVLDNPYSVLEEWRNGTLTRDHMEALEAVFPEVLNGIRKRIQEAVANGEVEPLPYQERAKISLLMGIPLDPSLSMQSVKYYQESFLDKEEQEQGIKANVGDAAGKHMTNLQRVGNV